MLRGSKGRREAVEGERKGSRKPDWGSSIQSHGVGWSLVKGGKGRVRKILFEDAEGWYREERGGEIRNKNAR